VALVVGSGRGDGPRWDAGALLATVGIDLGAVRRQVQERFGTDAIPRLCTREVGWNLWPRGPCGRPQLSHNSKRRSSVCSAVVGSPRRRG
jgi:hypothetical protein